MMVSYFINKNARKINDDFTRTELKSLRFKRNLCAINILSFAFAGYFFVRHNNYCETGGEYRGSSPNSSQDLTRVSSLSSLHAFRNDGIHRSINQHGLSYDCLLGFQWKKYYI